MRYKTCRWITSKDQAVNIFLPGEDDEQSWNAPPPSPKKIKIVLFTTSSKLLDNVNGSSPQTAMTYPQNRAKDVHYGWGYNTTDFPHNIPHCQLLSPVRSIFLTLEGGCLLYPKLVIRPAWSAFLSICCCLVFVAAELIAYTVKISFLCLSIRLAGVLQTRMLLSVMKRNEFNSFPDGPIWTICHGKTRKLSEKSRLQVERDGEKYGCPKGVLMMMAFWRNCLWE